MGAQVRQWSTESVDERQRLAYWMDSICDSFLEMKASPDPSAAFFGSIRQSALGRLGVYESLGSAQDVARDRAAIGRSSSNFYYLITQVGTPWSLRHAGRDVIVQPGDSVLVDSREPYEFGFPAGLHHLSLQLPIDWVNRWLPEPAAVLARPVDASQGWGAALRAFKQALTPEFGANPGLPAALLEDHLGVLMSLAFDALPQAERSHGLHGPYLRCVATMRGRISDAGLVGQDVARDCALSLRSLHRAFAAEGRTFAGVLREMRVAEADRMLGDRRFAAVAVVEIAQRCGYADASNFARQFRRLRGVSPGAFRKHAAA